MSQVSQLSLFTNVVTKSLRVVRLNPVLYYQLSQNTLNFLALFPCIPYAFSVNFLMHLSERYSEHSLLLALPRVFPNIFPYRSSAFYE